MPAVKPSCRSVGLAAVLTLVSFGLCAAQDDEDGGPSSVAAGAPRQAAGDPPPPAKWWVLLIAAENYDPQTSGQSKLDFCYADMAALRNDWLISVGVPANQIVFLHDQAAAEMRPTKSNIERELAAMAQRVTPENVLVLGAAMHGIQWGGQSYLCPLDAQMKPAAAAIDPLAANLIELPTVFEQVSGCQALFKLLLIDACRESLAALPAGPHKAAPGQRKEFIASLNRLREKTRGLAVLTSCSEGQSAYEDAQIKHGAFVHFLLQGLQGAADLYAGNNDGVVSLREAANYANRETKARIFRKYKRWQEPDLLLGEGTVNFPLVVLKSAPPPGTPEDDFAFMQRYGDLLAQWSMLGRAKEYDLSIDLLSQVVRGRPENREAHARRAMAYRAKGDYTLALSDFQRAGSPLELFVKFREASLAVEDKLTPVAPGVRVSVSQLQDDWFWVTAVDNDPSGRLQGWIDKRNVTWDPGLAELSLPLTPQRTAPDGAVLERLIEIANGLNYSPPYLATSVPLPGRPALPDYPRPWIYIPDPRDYIPTRPWLYLPSRPGIPAWRDYVPGIPLGIPSWRSFVPF